MNVEELAALKESLERERAERQLTEKELEEKVGALHSLNQELQLSNQKLEKLVADRAKELTRIARFSDENPSPGVRINRAGAVEYYNKAAAALVTNFENNDFDIKKVFKTWAIEAFSLKQNLDKELVCETESYKVSIVPVEEYDYVNLYFSNITNERNTHKKLEESEDRYRKIVEESIDIIIKMDLDGDLIYLNPAAETFFGYKKEELLGTNYSELLAGECKTKFFKTFGTLSEKQLDPNSSLVCSVQTRTKGVRWLSKNLQKSKDVLISSYTIIARDITETKLAEDKLIRSEDKYRRIIENMRLGLIEVDKESRILRVYDHFCKLTGYKEEELLGQVAMEIFVGEEGRKLVNEHRLRRMQGEETVYETVIKRKDGSDLWVLVSGTPLYDDDDNIIGSMGIHLDLTDQKRIEKELTSARYKAEESSRLKEQFLANMSHEIRTPMNAIIGMTNLLLKTNLNSEQRKMLNAVDVSSKNLLVVINDILDLSKVESGKMSLEKIGFNLRDSIKHVMLTKKIKSDKKELVLDYLVDENVANINIGDPYRLNQILLNLLSNALKFTETGGVFLKVSVSESTEKFQRLEFVVTDTGKGIAKDKLESIFDVFDQEDRTISRKFGGTGLGLSITKKLIELQGGSISVSSEEGVGSEFKFTLEYEIGSVSDLPETQHSMINFASLEGINVLLAEDNEFNQSLIEALFQQYKINLTIANNGVELLDKMEVEDYDIILMDIQMPIMDGLEATERIRKEPKWQSLPILALTANALHDDLQKYIDHGMNDYLSKPFNPDELYSKILNLVKGVGANPQAEGASESKKLYDLKKLEMLFGKNG